MNSQENSQNPVIVAFLLMGFIVVVALVFRPQAGIWIRLGPTSSEATIDRQPPDDPTSRSAPPSLESP